VTGPERCATKPRARDDAREMDRRPILNPSQERPVHVGDPHFGVWRRPPSEESRGER
jgi:hypothetical protein